MSTLAFLFPGQGSQQSGMGAELLQDDEIAELAGRCSEEAGVDLVRLLTVADDDELRLTTNAQPALLFVGLALARLLDRRGLSPRAAAGHSVGEYTALAVTGALKPEQAVKAVVERGRAMAEAAPPGTSSMAAVLGLEAQAVESALIGVPDVWPANYNTPTQTVIAGTMLGLEKAGERLRQAGARRVLPLNVAAAFHTPLMEPAGSALRSTLDMLDWRLPSAPVVANLTARPYEDASTIAAGLERQLCSPVRWGESMGWLGELGCDTFWELGPRRALTGMVKELVPGATATAIATPAAVEQLQLA
jgi:[acyl-carrier-protein] S-malonyltransferase